MRALFDDAAVLDDEDLVGRRTVDSRWAMTIDVRPSSAAASAFCTAASDDESSDAVASSSTTTRDLPRSRRAMVSRCRCPPDKRYPRSPTTVSRPSGISAMTSANRARSRSFPQFFVGRVRRRKLQVRPDRLVEQMAVLGDDSDGVLQ